MTSLEPINATAQEMCKVQHTRDDGGVSCCLIFASPENDFYFEPDCCALHKLLLLPVVIIVLHYKVVAICGFKESCSNATAYK
jgi:hypothetical protein